MVVLLEMKVEVLVEIMKEKEKKRKRTIKDMVVERITTMENYLTLSILLVVSMLQVEQNLIIIMEIDQVEDQDLVVVVCQQN